jgi:DNA-binding HxlR family transcriptional regulator
MDSSAPITPPQCHFRLRAIADTLYAIGGKWKLQIIVTLLQGETRFNGLQRTIEGISSKVLAAELKELELNGFVCRTVTAGPPIVVAYTLTEYSRSLEGVLDALFVWGVQHQEAIKTVHIDARRWSKRKSGLLAE